MAFIDAAERQTRLPAILTVAILHAVLGYILITGFAPRVIQAVTGQLKTFAVTSKTRLTGAPNLPTVDEAGMPGMYISFWHGLWMPRGVPKDIVARVNAAALGVQDRVAWLERDLLENVGGDFHMLICNPPYVSSDAMATLEPEVANFDPVLALDGGGDGLAVFRRLSTGRLGEVVGNGWVVLEVGHDQADYVAEMLRRVPAIGPAADVRFYTDVSGRRRCVAVRTRN